MNAANNKAPVGAGALKDKLLLGYDKTDSSAVDFGVGCVFLQELKPPPYSADTRAKGYRFELDYERIIQSDTWALASQEQRPWLLMCWFVAWQQTPCGSFPDDDLLIAARIGMNVVIFEKHRGVLLRGWEKHQDGRLYHPTITELVLEKIARRDRETQRKAEYRERMKSQNVPYVSRGTAMRQTQDSGGSDDTGTGTGKSKPSCAPSAREPATDGFEEFWKAYPKRVGVGAAEKAWKKLKPDLPIVLAAITRALSSNQWLKEGGRFIPHPVTWLNRRQWQDEPESGTTMASAVPDTKPRTGDTRTRHGVDEVFTDGAGWVPA